MRVGQARKRDAVEKAIVAALRAVGAQVTPISGAGAPDLLVRFRGRLYAFEAKAAKGTRTEAQQVTDWPIVRSVDEALRAIGAGGLISFCRVDPSPSYRNDPRG